MREDLSERDQFSLYTSSELRSCVKVEVVVLGSRPQLAHGLCGRKATLNQPKYTSYCAMARGHCLNIFVVLAAVHGILGFPSRHASIANWMISRQFSFIIVNPLRSVC